MCCFRPQRRCIGRQQVGLRSVPKYALDVDAIGSCDNGSCAYRERASTAGHVVRPFCSHVTYCFRSTLFIMANDITQSKIKQKRFMKARGATEKFDHLGRGRIGNRATSATPRGILAGASPPVSSTIHLSPFCCCRDGPIHLGRVWVRSIKNFRTLTACQKYKQGIIGQDIDERTRPAVRYLITVAPVERVRVSLCFFFGRKWPPQTSLFVCSRAML